MNKTAMKNFAVWARKKLREDITYKAGLLGVSEKGIAEPLPESSRDLQFFDIGTKAYGQAAGNEIKQRNALVHAIQEKARTSDYKTAFDAIIEEAAYTWFNRLLAIRLMEVNDYLPSRVRVLSSETSGKREPDMVTAPFDTDLEFTEAEQEKIMKLKDDASSVASDTLFSMLFIKQCNKLHEILPELFEETLDYTELLLNISFTDPDGIVSHLINDISEEDFDISRQGENGEAVGQVEIIGWLYQYYNDERKNEIINIYKGTVKKEDIPAATQLFTTDWVVRYMVDNSLGRYWIERHPESKLAQKLAFFVTPKNGQIQYIEDSIKPEDLKFLDPCMGSGHILSYAFEVLLYIYEECGYTERDAAAMIVQHNLYGLDIDNRAAQLAYFALMIKGRQHDRRFFSRGIKPHIYAIEESNDINRNQLAYFGADLSEMEKNLAAMQMTELLDTFTDAKEYGSILNVNQYDWDLLLRYVESVSTAGQLSFDAIGIEETQTKLLYLLEIAETMARKYQVVATNPPYMNKYDVRLKEFVKKNYKEYSGDLFSVFMYRNFAFCTENGYSAFMTPFVWMFIKTYEELRSFIIQNKSIITLVQMEYSAFEEATVPICSFVLKNSKTKENGLYFKLSDFKGGMDVQKQKVLEAIADKNCGYFFEANSTNFDKIPGSPVAYWVSEKAIAVYTKAKLLGDIASPRTGMTTGDNNRFLRLWFEIEFSKTKFNAKDASDAIASGKKWFPYCKGGGYMHWYGYNEYLVNWENDGFEIKNNIKPNGLKAASVRSESLYFKKLITWSAVTSASFSCRLCDGGSLFDSGGSSIDVQRNTLYILAILNSSIGQFYLDISNATINYQPGDIAGIPVVLPDCNEPTLRIEECVQIARKDWDSYETSWDFKRNPLV